MMSHSIKKAICIKGTVPSKLQRYQKGLTLVELCIVITVVGILAVGAGPSFLEWNKNRKVTKDARDLYSNMQLAKLAAIKEDASSVIILNPAAGTYQAFIDDGGALGVGSNNNVFDASERVVSTGTAGANTTMLVPAGQFAAGPAGFTSRGGALAGTTGSIVFNRTDQAGNPILWYRVRMATSGHLVFEFSTNSTNGIDGLWYTR